MTEQPVCIIPARGGSKRIPRKNIRAFNGKPLIAWSIETALKSGLFGRVLISTDDDEIAEAAGNSVRTYRLCANRNWRTIIQPPPR